MEKQPIMHYTTPLSEEVNRLLKRQKLGAVLRHSTVNSPKTIRSINKKCLVKITLHNPGALRYNMAEFKPHVSEAIRVRGQYIDWSELYCLEARR